MNSNHVMVRELKDYLMIALGMIFYGIGWTVFLLPNDLPSGAVPGIASIVYWGTGLPVQYTYFAINALLLLLSLKILGWKFSMKTVYAVFVLTFFLSVIQRFDIRASICCTTNRLWLVSWGAIFCGSGNRFRFHCEREYGRYGYYCSDCQQIQGCQLGAYDYVLRYDHHRVQLFCATRFGEGCLRVCDAVCHRYMIDQVVNSSRQSVQFFIISSKYEEIGREINCFAQRCDCGRRDRALYGKASENDVCLGKKEPVQYDFPNHQ